MNKTLEKIEKIKKLIKDADYILIGAGLSTAASIEYTGKRFTDNFLNIDEKSIIIQEDIKKVLEVINHS